MSSSARIDAAFPTPGVVNSSTVTSGGWEVDYDWVADRVASANVPRRIRFPAPFDRDLSGVLPGQLAFSAFRYAFRPDAYLRMKVADGLPDGPPAPTAPAWGLPATWTHVDAVFAGGGAKSGFAYFFRGPSTPASTGRRTSCHQAIPSRSVPTGIPRRTSLRGLMAASPARPDLPPKPTCSARRA